MKVTTHAPVPVPTTFTVELDEHEAKIVAALAMSIVWSSLPPGIGEVVKELYYLLIDNGVDFEFKGPITKAFHESKTREPI